MPDDVDMVDGVGESGVSMQLTLTYDSASCYQLSLLTVAA